MSLRNVFLTSAAIAFVGLLVVDCDALFTDPQPAVGPHKAIGWYEVDLDADPKDRWTALVEANRNATLKVVDYVRSEIPKAILPLCIAIVNEAEHFWPAELKGEMEGVAATLGIPVGEILALNLFYELNSGCTSIVAQHSVRCAVGGELLHACPKQPPTTDVGDQLHCHGVVAPTRRLVDWI